MKVYVDENDYVITYCAMTGRESLETSKSPIIVESLTDYTKQVRKEVCEKIKKQIFNHFNVKNMEEYENLSFIDSLFTPDAVIEMLDTTLKEYQK